jgi:putative phosphonate metabolism protein
MTPTPRYAIYYFPSPSSALARFGAETIGYDAVSGDAVPFPADIVNTLPDWNDLTQDPRKYGFHATLKAPFALADGADEAGLIAAFADFARTPRAIPRVTPVVEAISGFIAIVPAQRSAELQTLAQDCVTAFDDFRAPLAAADRARRNPDKLTPRQVEQLDRWGYPYVMDDFRFHMTLTGRLPDARRTEVVAMLRARFAELALAELAVDRIALFRQDDAASRFTIIRHDVLTAKS